jgi:HAE1 family hydrophobic/amphiphilic exporter-1
MAVGTVVFFGLSLATLVTLLVVPAIYHLIARRAGMTGARDRLVDEVLATAIPASPPRCRGRWPPRGVTNRRPSVPTWMTSRAPMGALLVDEI